MRKLILLAAGAASVGLSACSATTSFAPPKLRYEPIFQEISYSCASSSAVTPSVMLTRDVEGAQALIDIFVLSYRCAAHSAADGRQWFEVPSFLGLVGAAAAVAFGAGENVAIAASTGSAILNGGKAYYVPQQKAEILDHALDALLCIQTESVGVAAFTIPASEGEGRSVLPSRGGDSSVSIDMERQYYNMVASALFSVERVMAQRLNKVGSFEPAGVAAQIKELTKKADDAQANLDDAQTERSGRTGLTGRKTAELVLKVIQPKLQECVVRAKM